MTNDATTTKPRPLDIEAEATSLRIATAHLYDSLHISIEAAIISTGKALGYDTDSEGFQPLIKDISSQISAAAHLDDLFHSVGSAGFHLLIKSGWYPDMPEPEDWWVPKEEEP